jgi:hypothetical protein
MSSRSLVDSYSKCRSKIFKANGRMAAWLSPLPDDPGTRVERALGPTDLAPCGDGKRALDWPFPWTPSTHQPSRKNAKTANNVLVDR